MVGSNDGDDDPKAARHDGPERRVDTRRNGRERRSGLDRRVQDVPFDEPDRRSGLDRRKSNDRRQATELRRG